MRTATSIDVAVTARPYPTSAVLSIDAAPLALVLFMALSVFLGAMFHVEVAAVALVLLGALAFVMCPVQAKAHEPAVVLWLLVLQNLLIGTGAHLGGNSSTMLSLLTQVPFLVIVVFYLDVLFDDIRHPMVTSRNVWFILLVLWTLATAPRDGAAVAAKLVSLRNLVTFHMSWRVAAHWLRGPDQRAAFRVAFVHLCVLVTLVGFVSMLLSFSTWLDLGLAEVYVAKGSSVVTSGWGGRFITSIDGRHRVLRMLSTYYEPVNLAYLLSAGLLCEIARKRRGLAHGFSLLVLFAGLVMTFGKGGWVMFAMGLLCMAPPARRSRAARVTLVLILSAALMFLYYQLIGGAVRPHFWAIERTWESILRNPLGHGLGSGGNASRFFTGTRVDDDLLSMGGESALMAFGYQLGLVGLLCLVMQMTSLSKAVSARDRMGRLCFAIPVLLLLVALLQDNTFTPQCVVPFMFLVGSASSYGADRGDAS